LEAALTPLEFARRTRRLHGSRIGVIDGDRKLTYEQFFGLCDRWSAVLHGLGVQPGDRVATISPNTVAQLASFYAVPQLGVARKSSGRLNRRNAKARLPITVTRVSWPLSGRNSCARK